MSRRATADDLKKLLNDHCENCSVCRSPSKGLCSDADVLLDALLNALYPRDAAYLEEIERSPEMARLEREMAS